MNEIINRIQLVVNTLEQLEIRATQSNMDKLLGCMQVLGAICNELTEVDNGNADAE